MKGGIKGEFYPKLGEIHVNRTFTIVHLRSDLDQFHQLILMLPLMQLETSDPWGPFSYEDEWTPKARTEISSLCVELRGWWGSLPQGRGRGREGAETTRRTSLIL